MKTEVQIKNSEIKLRKEFEERKLKKINNLNSSIEKVLQKKKNLERELTKLQVSLQKEENREFVSPIPSTEVREQQRQISLSRISSF